jgi:DNA-binding transcriptional ArsR family regulator
MTIGPLVQITATLKVLAHPARLRLLAMLRSGGLCVCQAAAALGSPVSTVSEHLSELKRAGLVAEHRQGRWVTYSLDVAPEARGLLCQLFELLAADALIQQDAGVVKRVRRVSPTDLCDAGLDLRRFGIEPAGSEGRGR